MIAKVLIPAMSWNGLSIILTKTKIGKEQHNQFAEHGRGGFWIP